MPPKIRELIMQLEHAGFKNRGGKGSHRNFVHTNVNKPITISGRLGDDAKPYQVRAVRSISYSGVEKMKDSAKYVKIVEWSEADQCYVGSVPSLILGGCHGQSKKAVFDELCQIVEEAIAIYRKEGKPLPPATADRDYAKKLQSAA